MDKSKEVLMNEDEYIQFMQDATPFCCNLWNTDFNIIDCNQEAVSLFGLNGKREYIANYYKLSPQYQPCGRLSSELIIEKVKEAFEKGKCSFEWIHQKLNGEKIPSEITLVRKEKKDRNVVVGYVRTPQELSETISLVNQLEKLAYTDSLTGAHNRHYFTKRLGDTFEVRNKNMVTLIMFDLDHFKYINDTYGHMIGDEVLKFVVNKVRNILRTEDLLVRYGGDEFIIMARDMDQATGKKLAARIHDGITDNKFKYADTEFKVTVSIGVITTQDGDMSIDEALRSLDEALYIAKKSGRNRISGNIDVKTGKKTSYQISIESLVNCLSDVIDLISPVLKDHHKKTAVAAYLLATELGITKPEKERIVIAAALHDVGGISLADRTTAIEHIEDNTRHGERGYRLLKGFEPFSDIADLVRYHHAPWDYGKNPDLQSDFTGMASQIIFMADRVAVALNPQKQPVSQASAIVAFIKGQENIMFRPEVVAAFQKRAMSDSFWLDITSGNISQYLGNYEDIYLTDDDLQGLLDVFSHIVDYRSRFTSTHSKEVSVVAEAISRLMGFSDNEAWMIRIAGLLHDFGKLVVPTEILEKSGPLDAYESDIIRTHAYYTNRLLSSIPGFETIREWAACHHESLDGSGYPFNLRGEEISLGSRIIKVADIFVALSEERPYRKGLQVDMALSALQNMADKYKVDSRIVDVLIKNSQYINSLRCETVLQASRQYEEFIND